MESPPRKLVICGGGIMGCATAFYLSKIGSNIEVTLVERNEVAGHASGKAGGFLAKDWCAGAVDILAKRGFELHEELGKEFPDAGYRKVDTLDVSKKLTGKHPLPGWMDGNGLSAATIMGDHKSTAQVHPEKLTKAMFESAVASGKTKLQKGIVEGVVMEDKVIKGVKVDGKVIDADLVLIAMGPWADAARKWFPDANLPNVVGHRAHSIVMEGPEAAKVGAQAIFLHYDGKDPEIYPRPDGTLYMVGFNDDESLPEDPAQIYPKESSVKGLKELADRVSSGLKECSVTKEQACYLPYSSNGAPLIGVIPKYTGAYLAAGHSCWGILTGPATGLALAEMMEFGQTKTVDVKGLKP